MTEIELFSAEACPFAQRTRLLLLEKGIAFNLTEIDLENKPDWFLEISPYGKVPLIKHENIRIYESSIINEYLEETFPTHPLLPEMPPLRAQARIWIDYCNNKLSSTIYSLLREGEKEKREPLKTTLRENLLFIEQEGLQKLSRHGPYWLGEEISLVDISYYPFFERFCVLEHYRDMHIPAECMRLLAWREEMASRESVKAIKHGDEYYLEHYARFVEGKA